LGAVRLGEWSQGLEVVQVPLEFAQLVRSIFLAAIGAVESLAT